MLVACRLAGLSALEAHYPGPHSPENCRRFLPGSRLPRFFPQMPATGRGPARFA
jgi:hypothetical protein